ncbi:MAG: CPBP family intramembrane metalloprotease [Oscillospiraceae bacterium]|nr:CPBP family intramembrane metalloprotease [Oscillospiraceae bacterium]
MHKSDNRWVYSTKREKIKFSSAVHIISLASVLQLFIYETLPGIIYAAAYNLTASYYDVFGPDFFNAGTFEEINYIIVNSAVIITSAAASLFAGAFIILCMRKFPPDPYRIESKDGVSFRLKLPSNTLVLLAMGICIVQLSVFIYINIDYFVNSAFGAPPGFNNSGTETYFPVSAAGTALYFIAVVVTPSFTEEFIYRYIMLNALKRYGNTFAIIVTSVLFGFAHGRVNAFIYATVIGFFSAYIALKTKSIWFSILLHVTINAMSFVMHRLSSYPGVEEALVNIIYFAFLCIASFVSSVYLIILIVKRREPKLGTPEDYIHISKKRKVIIFFNAATVLFFILSIVRSLEDIALS